MLTDQFTRIFREEHRIVRDTLLDLIDAFKARDRERARSLLQQAAAFVGPHFRYEEEALYPALVTIFGPEYIEKLLTDHDGAIRTAAELVDLAGKESLTDAEVMRATRDVQRILPHVSDCDGLSIMVERLPEETVQRILDVREKARQEGLDLLTWANTVRARPLTPTQATRN